MQRVWKGLCSGSDGSQHPSFLFCLKHVFKRASKAGFRLQQSELVFICNSLSGAVCINNSAGSSLKTMRCSRKLQKTSRHWLNVFQFSPSSERFIWTRLYQSVTIRFSWTLYKLHVSRHTRCYLTANGLQQNWPMTPAPAHHGTSSPRKWQHKEESQQRGLTPPSRSPSFYLDYSPILHSQITEWGEVGLI